MGGQIRRPYSLKWGVLKKSEECEQRPRGGAARDVAGRGRVLRLFESGVSDARLCPCISATALHDASRLRCIVT
jgi:hypothetical protein